MQKGNTNFLMITGVTIAVIVLGSIGLYTLSKRPASPVLSEVTSDMLGTDSPKEVTADEKKNSASRSAEYSGVLLAGMSSPLLDFSSQDYQAALNSDKLIILYFYANWCPLCKAEFPKMEQTFNDLTTDKVIGFRVNYNDNQTDQDEISLAREFGVAYQHTKIFVKNKQRVLKSPESWDSVKYLEEINKYLTP